MNPLVAYKINLWYILLRVIISFYSLTKHVSIIPSVIQHAIPFHKTIETLDMLVSLFSSCNKEKCRLHRLSIHFVCTMCHICYPMKAHMNMTMAKAEICDIENYADTMPILSLHEMD